MEAEDASGPQPPMTTFVTARWKLEAMAAVAEANMVLADAVGLMELFVGKAKKDQVVLTYVEADMLVTFNSRLDDFKSRSIAVAITISTVSRTTSSFVCRDFPAWGRLAA